MKIIEYHVYLMFNRIIGLTKNFSIIKLNYQKMSSKNIVRISLCQLNSRDNKNENFKIGEKLIHQAKNEQAQVSFERKQK